MKKKPKKHTLMSKRSEVNADVRLTVDTAKAVASLSLSERLAIANSLNSALIESLWTRGQAATRLNAVSMLGSSLNLKFKI